MPEPVSPPVAGSELLAAMADWSAAEAVAPAVPEGVPMAEVSVASTWVAIGDELKEEA